MLTDHERIARQQGDPALLRLQRALSRLKSVLTYMNTGAHPDDEHSGLLAALRFHYGMRIVVACATRGEGGQNAVGPERGAALGVLRTREMEASARVIDAGIVWLGHGPDDPIHDFGFSKSGEDTLARWGERRIIERLVRAYRIERPDIVSPTFLDVPGQHGHHRAMTRAAIEAFALAADPAAFPEHFAEGLQPWQVAKLYLPAWSGAGTSYDDEEPPPPETVAVEPPRRDQATGATYAQIGEWSRACHRSQGMGIWRDEGRTRWPLHLLLSTRTVAGPEREHRGRASPRPRGSRGTAGPSRLGSRRAPGSAGLRRRGHRSVPLRRCDHARPLFRPRDGSTRRAKPALPEWLPQLDHRLARKSRELDMLLFEAQGIVARAAATPSRLAPGGAAAIDVFVDAGADARCGGARLEQRRGNGTLRCRGRNPTSPSRLRPRPHRPIPTRRPSIPSAATAKRPCV